MNSGLAAVLPVVSLIFDVVLCTVVTVVDCACTMVVEGSREVVDSAVVTCTGGSVVYAASRNGDGGAVGR